MMNNELLKLFDIKDDVVDTFVDNVDSNYEINIRFKPSRLYCPSVAALILSIKVIEKDPLYPYLSNDKPVKMSTYVKRYRCFDCDTSFSDVNPIYL